MAYSKHRITNHTRRLVEYDFQEVTYVDGLANLGVEQSQGYFEVSWTDEAHGDVNPGWRKIIKSGGQATTPFEGYKTHVKAEGGNLRSEYTNTTVYDDPLSSHDVLSSTYGRSGQLVNLPFPGYDTGMDVASADNQAKIAFLNKCRGAQTAFQGGVFIGELRETLHSIRHPAQAIRRGIDAYAGAARKNLSKLSRQARNNPVSNKQVRKMLSSTWLEYSYGWKPLASDISDATEALARQITRHSRTSSPMIRGNGKEILNDFTIQDFASASVPGYAVVYSWRFSGSVSVKYYGKVQLETEKTLPSLQQNLGLQLQDFVPTVWELIPYSFLVDYFTNIGDLLSAYSVAKSSISWVSKTVRMSNQSSACDLRVEKSGESPGFSFRAGGAAGNLSYDAAYVTRRLSDVNALDPGFEFKVPGPSSLKWLNIGALARQRSLR